MESAQKVQVHKHSQCGLQHFNIVYIVQEFTMNENFVGKTLPVTFRHSLTRNHQKKRNGVEVRQQKEFSGELIFELLPRLQWRDSWKNIMSQYRLQTG